MTFLVYDSSSRLTFIFDHNNTDKVKINKRAGMCTMIGKHVLCWLLTEF